MRSQDPIRCSGGAPKVAADRPRQSASRGPQQGFELGQGRLGLDKQDRRYLETLIGVFDGGPTGAYHYRDGQYVFLTVPPHQWPVWQCRCRAHRSPSRARGLRGRSRRRIQHRE